MANNILNPLEKELLIKLYRRSPGVKIADFCKANNVSAAAFQTWLKKYNADGLVGLYRSKRMPSILPEGVEESEENLRRELIRTRLELERLKKNYTSFHRHSGGRPHGGNVRPPRARQFNTHLEFRRGGAQRA